MNNYKTIKNVPTVKMLKINMTGKWACLLFLQMLLMFGAIFKSAMCKFASKVCCERHDLCLFFYYLKL